jgi:hypothetical protein
VNVARLRRNRFLLPPLALALALVSAACSLGGESAPVVQQPAGQQQVAPTPTPTPTPLAPEPTPTLTPAPLTGRAEAEGIVLRQITACATALGSGGESATAVRIFFDSSYDAPTRSWAIQAITTDFAVTLGTWRVDDGGAGVALPRDYAAQQIALGRSTCAYPTVLLDGEPAPPLFADPVTGGSGAVITNASLAALRVWSSIYSCSQDYPSLDSFTGLQDMGGVWLVEGRTDDTSYGLWEVDAATGAVGARDERAQAVEAACGAAPVALTAEQATVRVWVATYDCFTPPPSLDNFTATRENTSRWVVEGRGLDALNNPVLYGLWLVYTNTGNVSPLDADARATRVLSCFQPFQ